MNLEWGKQRSLESNSSFLASDEQELGARGLASPILSQSVALNWVAIGYPEIQIHLFSPTLLLNAVLVVLTHQFICVCKFSIPRGSMESKTYFKF